MVFGENTFSETSRRMLYDDIWTDNLLTCRVCVFLTFENQRPPHNLFWRLLNAAGAPGCLLLTWSPSQCLYFVSVHIVRCLISTSGGCFTREWGKNEGSHQEPRVWLPAGGVQGLSIPLYEGFSVSEPFCCYSHKVDTITLETSSLVGLPHVFFYYYLWEK